MVETSFLVECIDKDNLLSILDDPVASDHVDDYIFLVRILSEELVDEVLPGGEYL